MVIDSAVINNRVNFTNERNEIFILNSMKSFKVFDLALVLNQFLNLKTKFFLLQMEKTF